MLKYRLIFYVYSMSIQLFEICDYVLSTSFQGVNVSCSDIITSWKRRKTGRFGSSIKYTLLQNPHCVDCSYKIFFLCGNDKYIWIPVCWHE